MPVLSFTIGQFAGVFSFVAYLFYILAIVRGTTKPARATWWILAIIGFITLLSYRAVGAEDTLWVVLGDFAGVLCIAVLSIWYGVGGREKTDLISLAGAGLSLFLWWLLDSPLAALITNLAVDVFAAIPTIIKTYYEPVLEDRFAWSLTFLANILSLFAVERWVLSIAIYPVYTSIIDGIVWLLIFLPRRDDGQVGLLRNKTNKN